MSSMKSPHFESQQNSSPAESDQIESTAENTQSAIGAEVGRDPSDQTFDAQTGSNRGPQFFPPTTRDRNSEPQNAAYQGSVETRTPHSDQQGITAHSATEESGRQEKVIPERPDAQAGVNHAVKKSA